MSIIELPMLDARDVTLSDVWDVTFAIGDPRNFSDDMLIADLARRIDAVSAAVLWELPVSAEAEESLVAALKSVASSSDLRLVRAAIRALVYFDEAQVWVSSLLDGWLKHPENLPSTLLDQLTEQATGEVSDDPECRATCARNFANDYYDRVKAMRRGRGRG